VHADGSIHLQGNATRYPAHYHGFRSHTRVGDDSQSGVTVSSLPAPVVPQREFTVFRNADRLFERHFHTFKRLRQLADPDASTDDEHRLCSGTIEEERMHAMRSTVRRMERAGWEIFGPVERLFLSNGSAPREHLLSPYIDAASRHLVRRMIDDTADDLDGAPSANAPRSE
jgi:hypothetical protein